MDSFAIFPVPNAVELAQSILPPVAKKVAKIDINVRLHSNHTIMIYSDFPLKGLTQKLNMPSVNTDKLKEASELEEKLMKCFCKKLSSVAKYDLSLGIPLTPKLAITLTKDIFATNAFSYGSHNGLTVFVEMNTVYKGVVFDFVKKYSNHYISSI